MELITQPFTGQLGDRLIELLESGEYSTLNIMVAFAKNSGVLRIKDSLQNFRKHGARVNVYVGIDFEGTSYEALTSLLVNSDTLSIVHTENHQTFHPKIYHFLGDKKGMLVVGSHNLTGGGLWTNFESSVLIPIETADDQDMRLVEAVENHMKALEAAKASYMPIANQADIEKLLQNGYVLKEVANQVQRAKQASKPGDLKRLFGSGVPAKIPPTGEKSKGKAAPPPASSPKILPTQEDSTIWLETKRLTGGSRNILDLSMRSLVEHGDPSGTPFDLGEVKFMRGAVGFFGLNPVETEKSKDITINFEGVDYIGNTILFPDGKKPNGTWRLQIKGVSSSDEKITEAFRRKGEEHYLVEKVVTFTKIDDNYYFISVFPDSEIASFKASSRILARNGPSKSAKWFGVL